MAQTVAATVLRVRSLVRDRSMRQPVFDSDEIVDAIERCQFPVLAEMPGILAWNAAWLTLVAGTAEYTQGTADAHSFNHFRLTSTGEPVRKVEPGIFDELRSGNPVATGDPVILSLLETTSQTYTVRVWPTPIVADTIEGLRATMPASITIASSLVLSRYALRAIEYRAASELLTVAAAEKLATIGADKSAAKPFLDYSQRMIALEKERLNSQRRSEVIVNRNPF